MSATATPPSQPEAAPLTGEQAEAVLVRDVFAPLFFDKAASLGHVPQTADQATTMLRIGQKLLAADREEQVKAAAARTTGLSAMEAALDSELNARYGFQIPAQADPSEAAVLDKVAAHYGAIPEFQRAVDAYNAAFDAPAA